MKPVLGQRAGVWLAKLCRPAVSRPSSCVDQCGGCIPCLGGGCGVVVDGGCGDGAVDEQAQLARQLVRIRWSQVAGQFGQVCAQRGLVVGGDPGDGRVGGAEFAGGVEECAAVESGVVEPTVQPVEHGQQ